MIESIQGQYIDIFNRTIFPAEIKIYEGKILEVISLEVAPDQYLLPGFVDAHIHIESSMLVPSEFARIAVLHGTLATVSDPHEIANVCGVAGVEYMLDNARLSPFKFNFGAPSCVPATAFETAGATLDAAQVALLLQREEIKYLSEVMNFPAVLSNDADMMAKIDAARRAGKPVDGHAPGLRGDKAKQYAAAGISTDHECVDKDEALDKLEAGMYILIREGSAAKNFDALIDLLKSHPGRIMFCSDDKHPHELVKGHINQLVQRALARGCDLFDVLYAACVLPVIHYGLDVGLLRKGDPADFIVVGDLQSFALRAAYIDGNKVVEEGICLMPALPVAPINQFNAGIKTPADFVAKTGRPEAAIDVRVIEALDGQLVTRSSIERLPVDEEEILVQPEIDVIKIGVVNRYQEAPPALGFVRNFGLKSGAIASTVAHDSHNIVFVGVDETSIAAAVNALITAKGGISVTDGETTRLMPLPVAGLMTDTNAATAADEYEQLDQAAKKLGCTLAAPFMTLSFMALPVIPSLKMTDKGLFDVDKFAFTTLEEQ